MYLSPREKSGLEREISEDVCGCGLGLSVSISVYFFSLCLSCSMSPVQRVQRALHSAVVSPPLITPGRSWGVWDLSRHGVCRGIARELVYWFVHIDWTFASMFSAILYCIFGIGCKSCVWLIWGLKLWVTEIMYLTGMRSKTGTTQIARLARMLS